ncbi:hypothetical protein PMIN06_005237, partial [Paraphaeosphaeria minitans]
MGWSFHGHKRDVDKERHLKSLHKTVPGSKTLSRALTTNTSFSRSATRRIPSSFSSISYVGIFGILWSSWLQVTLHDVRFARDSLYERVCKTIQFIVFVGLALVGSSFNPGKEPTGAKKASNTNFRILCYTLVISRGLLAIQHVVVL